MKKNQEKVHVCKLCKKSFLTGKMLGGHMKIHGARKSIKEYVKFESNNMGSECHGLREQPKKSWKFSGLNHDGSVSMQETSKCRVCGKEFGSPKSLHGHMRHHSAKERKAVYCEECGRGFLSLKSLSNHMRLHHKKLRVSSSGPNLVVMALSATETVNLVRRKRSSRMRYKITPNSSFSRSNESVSGFDIEQEVEEVAITLIMMSRGECNGFDSLCQSKRIEIGEGYHGFDGNGFVRPKKTGEDYLDSCDLDYKISVSGGEGDIGMGYGEANQVRLEVPTESFHKDVESKSPQLDDESGVEFCGIEIEKGGHGELITNCTVAESSLDLMGGVGLDAARLGFQKSIPINQANFDASDAEMGQDAGLQMVVATDSDIAESPSKKGDFRCRICNRNFISYQSLGGHQTFHRKSSIGLKVDSCKRDIRAIFSPETKATGKLVKIECIQESVKQETDGVIVKDCESKEGKEHKCPVCFKVFLSGQALGGHKRAHFPKAREEQNTAVNREVSDICNVFTINVPYTVAPDVSNDVRCESWWPANSHKHEPLVGLIAN
ncbi:zinc finger protein with KRAB and SCAN domains 5-like [Populus alba x Populus x berolinensis]|nr:zinc finger protein with KRAB and SCAN domains 5-like [Populus alba x Populus x berolinensis]